MTLANWRDLAIVLLALEIFVMLIAPTVGLFLAVRGLLWVQKQIRKYGPLVQLRFRQAAHITEEASQKVAAPLIAVSAARARVQGVRAGLTSSPYVKEV